MPGMYPGAFITLWDDFLFDNVTRWVETVASSATQDIRNLHGGWWRQTLAGDDADACMIGAELAFEVDEGFPLVFETRLQTSDADKSSIFVGMSDNNAESGAVVIEDEDGTLNTVATDAFGFLLEGEQDTTWQAVGVQNDTDNTQDALTSGADAADSVIQVLRMEAEPTASGTVRYYVGKAHEMGGGLLVATKTGWFRSGILYTPVASSDDRATAYTVDYDYIYVTTAR